jgi:hypothetical protein
MEPSSLVEEPRESGVVSVEVLKPLVDGCREIVTVLSFPGGSICVITLVRGSDESVPALDGRLAEGAVWKDSSGEEVDSLLEGDEKELLEVLLDASAPTESRCMESLSQLVTNQHEDGIPFRKRLYKTLGVTSECNMSLAVLNVSIQCQNHTSELVYKRQGCGRQ